MRQVAFSVLSLFVVLPALADARLPVVNVSAGSVSARSAFGDTPAAVPVSPAQNATRKIVPRPKNIARAATPVVASANAMDVTTPLADVLSPRRPSSDLWATSDAPLRMPRADEFAVIGENYTLPEESLDTMPAPRVAAAPVALPEPATVAQPPMQELDAQIAKLVELQRRADESARNVAPRPSTISSPVYKSENVVAHAELPAPERVAPEKTADNVKLSRLVVPMDTPDVVMRTVKKTTSPRIAATREDMTKMTPNELRRAFRKTFLSENKHLSTYPIDSRFDEASTMDSYTEGFTANHDLSEGRGIRPLEIKIAFRDSDSALSRDNYDLLSTYASIAINNPKRAIQVAIPERSTRTSDGRKLAARRLAIVEQVLRDTGVAEQRIMPVLASRDDDSFVLRIISGDQYETMTQKQRDMFGDTVSKKTYKSMSW